MKLLNTISFLIFFINHCCNGMLLPPSTTPSARDNLKVDSLEEREIRTQCIFLDKTYIHLAATRRREQFLYKLNIYGKKILMKDVNALQSCPGSIVAIQVISNEIIIIDEDYDSEGEDITFVLVAPLIIVQNKRKIILNGRDGHSHKKSRARDGFSDRIKLANGLDGKQGIPGGPAGVFIGIAGTIFDKSNLTIEVNGGRGGPGQSGGHGAMGKSGTRFDVSKTMIRIDGKVEKFETLLQRNEPNGIIRDGCDVSVIEAGQIGTNGGRGGDGGRGGEGGFPGVVTFFELDDNCTRHINYPPGRYGENGEDGLGGKGGDAGYHGSDLYLDLHYSEVSNNITVSKYEKSDHPRTFRGRNGEDGSTFDRRLKAALHPKFQSFKESLKAFDDFATPYLRNSSDAGSAKDLHKKIHELCKIDLLCTVGCD